MFEGMDATVRALLFGGLFLVSLTAVLWAVYHGQGRGASGWSLMWWVLGGIGVILVLPALIINAFQLDPSDQNLIDPLSYLGVIGVLLALVCTGGYFISASAESEDDYPTEPVQILEPEAPMRTEIIETLDDDGDEGPKTIVMRRPTSRMASLWIKNGPRRNTQFSLSDVTSIGRSGQKNDIILADESVSGEHARVRFDLERNAYVFRDLDSTNGSWLVTTQSRDRIEAPHILRDGDEIEVGSTVLVFKEVLESSTK
jgi:hypothetical protein